MARSLVKLRGIRKAGDYLTLILQACLPTVTM